MGPGGLTYWGRVLKTSHSRAWGASREDSCPAVPRPLQTVCSTMERKDQALFPFHVSNHSPYGASAGELGLPKNLPSKKWVMVG